MTAAPLPTAKAPPQLVVAPHTIVVVDIELVDTDDANFRLDWTSAAAVDALEALATSIALNGLEEPPKLKIHPTAVGRFIASTGNRRLTAIKRLLERNIPVRGYPLGKMPCMLLPPDMDHRDERISSLITNTQRSDLNPMEEAIAYLDMLRTGVPFMVGQEKIYIALNDDEIKLVIGMAGIFAADIEPKLKVRTTFKHFKLPKLTVFDVVKQLMKTCTKMTKVESLVKRLVLINLIEEVQNLVARGQMTINFAYAMSPLARNYQFKALEKWNASNGKITEETFQAMCLALAQDQAADAQMSLFDDNFWQTQAIEEQDESKRGRRGKKYGLRTNKKADTALEPIRKLLTRSLPNTDTALAIVDEQLRRQGDHELADTLNSFRELLLERYFTNPADTATVLAHLQKE